MGNTGNRDCYYKCENPILSDSVLSHDVNCTTSAEKTVASCSRVNGIIKNKVNTIIITTN